MKARKHRSARPRGRGLLAALALSLLVCPSAASAKRPPRLRAHKLQGLLRHALANKSSLRTLLRRVDRKLRKPRALASAFVKENTDERHPALSTPWDLPKSEYPHRAVVLRRVRLGKIPAELRVVTDLRALSPRKGGGHLQSRDTTLIVMLTASERQRPLPSKTIKRLLRRLGLSVYAGGSLGACKDAREWCRRRRYSFLPKRGRRQGTLLIQHDAAGNIGGLKLIARKR